MKSCIVFVLITGSAVTAFAQQSLHRFGTVHYPDGKPAAGVHITFYPGSYFSDDDYNYHEAITDTNGWYEILPPKKVSDFTWGPDYPTNTIMARYFEKNLAAVEAFSVTTTHVNLILQPAITLSGSVKNTEGAPVSGAEIDLGFVSARYGPQMRPPFKANEQGQFSIPALPQGTTYMISGITANGYGSSHATVKVKDTQTNHCEFPTFVLKHADRILAGRVVDNNGKPLAGTRVSFSGADQPQNNSTNTDSDGRFFFDAVCDGSLKVFANYHDPQDISIHMSLNGGGGMEVKPGDTNILIQLRDTSISAWDVPTLVTKGTVFDSAGGPVPGVVFVVWDSANPFNHAYSGHDGKYRIRWQRPLGQGRHTAAKSVLIGRDTSRNLVVTQEIDETTTNLDLHLQPGLVVAGILQDESGMTVTNARVSLDMHLARGGAELTKTTTDEHGAFAFSALPAQGEYSLEVGTAHSGTRGSPGVIQVTGGETNLVLRHTSPLANYD